MLAVAPDKNALSEKLNDDIVHDRIHLPTLPEVALKVREAVEQENVDGREIAQMVGQDAALSARLLQVANSPLYRGRVEVDSVKMAVTRLGQRTVQSLVISLAMKQMYQATSDVLDAYLRRVREDSLQVAAISRVLAASLTSIDNDQAMLAGLLHNIGALPILGRLDEELGFNAQDRLVAELIAELGPTFGRHILAAWRFPQSLVAVPVGCVDLRRDPQPTVEIVDVVLVARLQYLVGSGHPDAAVAWNELPAFTKVGLNTDVDIVDMEGSAEQIAEVRAALDS
jgi:HD-like signal output (HDOD) protein